MISFIGAILALLGLVDLFSDPGKRSLPWWGDLIAIGAGAAIAIVSRALGDDD